MTKYNYRNAIEIGRQREARASEQREYAASVIGFLAGCLFTAALFGLALDIWVY